MKSVEFRIHPTFWQYIKARWIGYWLCRRPRICAGLTLFFSFFLATVYTDSPQYRFLIPLAGFFVLGAWLSSFAHLFLTSLSDYKDSGKLIKEPLHQMDEQGYSIQASWANVCLNWQYFRRFRETRKYFFLTSIEDAIFIISKNSISYETVCSMRKVLEAAPVKKKRLRSEN